jgi:hypothetical protein
MRTLIRVLMICLPGRLVGEDLDDLRVEGFWGVLTFG